jgi:hypothetical protein
MPRVYLETTVLSYLVAVPSRVPTVHAHQLVTARWWAVARERFEIVVSIVTLNEASAGDPGMARARLNLVANLPAIPVTDEAEQLASYLVRSGALPPKALGDALHLATATANGVEYLVTWNLKHLAGAVVRRRLENALRSRGYDPPTICTPEELLGDPEAA